MKSCYSEMSSGNACENELSPILFLHGMYESKISWKKVGPLIAKNTGRKAFSLDARNHGGSPRSPVMNFDVLVEDILEFMDDLSIPKVVIVGHSMGGRTAINIALKHPQRVSALIVEDMSPIDMESKGLKVTPMASKMCLELLKRFPPDRNLDEVKRESGEIMMMMVGKEYIDEETAWKYYDPEMVPLIKKGKAFVPLANVEPVLSMMESNFLVQNLPGQNLIFEGDALFLYGSKRPFFDLEEDTTVKKLFPRAVVKKIEGASHLIHYDSPDEFTQVVSDFIRDISEKTSPSDSG